MVVDQVTGTTAVLAMWSKVHVLLLRHLHRHRSRVSDCTLMMALQQQMRVVRWCVTQTVRTCASLDREDSVTYCQWSPMIPEAAALIPVLQGAMHWHRQGQSVTMITLDITTTQQRRRALGLSTA